ncbi:MAG: bifunctional adenosylcobinamide kinase/adenosylcobinamide-phosphate guanylyltransferase [Ruminococcus sp.]|nr:bifunctional adenosylcobinamide kinase/adenosylcobinamide-phosphate guanylyltransferase [Ruminococcus sp.]
MILIVGGAFQGKTNYAVSRFSLSHSDVARGSECRLSDVLSARCVADYHQLVRRLLSEGSDPLIFTEQLCAENEAAVVIMDEIGCGVIPLEKSERIWREAVGRCGCMLAERADIVIRMICGIPTVIKGELP